MNPLNFLIALLLSASAAHARGSCEGSSYYDYIKVYNTTLGMKDKPADLLVPLTDANVASYLPKVLNFAAAKHRDICLPSDNSFMEGLLEKVKETTAQSSSESESVVRERIEKGSDEIVVALRAARDNGTDAHRVKEVQSTFKLFALAAKKDPSVKLKCVSHLAQFSIDEGAIYCQAERSDNLDVFRTRETRSEIIFLTGKDENEKTVVM